MCHFIWTTISEKGEVTQSNLGSWRNNTETKAWESNTEFHLKLFCHYLVFLLSNKMPQSNQTSIAHSETKNVLEICSEKCRSKNKWHFSLVSLRAFSTSLSVHIGLGYGFHPGIEMDSHRKNSDMSGNLELSMKPWRMNVSVFVPLSFSVLHPSILSWLRILSSAGSSSHMDSSAFQGLWQPVRHSEDPPLMFQRSAARLHNFPASMARGAKALNCCLEILCGS